MARAPRDSRLESKAARRKLPIQAEPYWRRIGEGLFIGYRRTVGTAAWICRKREGGRYIEQRIGTPDDHLDADNKIAFTYDQACALVRGVASETLSPAPKHYGDGLSINDCWQLYRDGHLANKASLRDADIFWRLHVQDSIGNKMVVATTADDYSAWLKALAVKPPTRRGKELPFDAKDATALAARAASASRVWTVVKAALTYAKRAGKLNSERAPWMEVQKIKVNGADEQPPRMLDQGEVKRLLNACPNDLRSIVTGALMTGARYGELAEMTVRAFDTETDRIAIRQTKTGKRLYQPLTPEGVKFFERLTAGRATDEAMFMRADGNKWEKSQQQRPIKEAAKAAKIPDVSFKVTRATYGKMLLLATKDIELVAKALGHSDTRITRKHYAQYLPDELEAGVRKMSALGIKVNDKVKRLKTPTVNSIS